MAASEGGRWVRGATDLGMVKSAEGAGRSHWARVVQVGADSSTLESVMGFAFAVVVLAAVVSKLFVDPIWFRVIAGISTILLTLNVVQMLSAKVRSHRRR